MDAPNTRVDHFVMLLSTDWFSPYWSEIGIIADESQRSFVRHGCREIVKEMLAGAEQYYFISFAPERLELTRNRFWQLFAKAAIAGQGILNLREIFSWDSDTSGARWLIILNTEMLIKNDQNLPSSKDIPVLSPAIMKVLRDWSARQPERIEFNPVCMASKTEWDSYVRSLTPELPASLADDVQVGIIGELKFKDLLLSIGALSPHEKIELERWYSVVARRLVGADDVASRVSEALQTSI